MATIRANDVKKGMKIMIEGKQWPHVVVDVHLHKPGKGTPTVQVKARDMFSKSNTEKTYKAEESIEMADVQQITLTYTYIDGDFAVFSDPETFETTNVSLDTIDENQRWLKEGENYGITIFKGLPFEIVPPQKMELTITQTSPGEKGDTATNATKGATLETGFEVQVPLFINEGDSVIMNTETGKYESRGKKA